MTVELELRGITKRFPAPNAPGVLANDHIDLTVHRGQIHAVVGENGAGKTTLMSILYGLYHADEGEILLRGTPARFGSPVDAIAAGLGMVHQAFKLFPTLTVAENVVFGAEPRAGLALDRRAAAERVAELARRYGLQVDPAARVDRLPVGVLQRVEILKALYRDARVLILDEPTAVLTPQEREGLFEVLRSLARDGRTILFITHKLSEVMALADRVTVLRDGRAVADLVTARTTPAEIASHMTGRRLRGGDVEGAVPAPIDRPSVRPPPRNPSADSANGPTSGQKPRIRRPVAHPPGAPALEVEGLTVAGDGGRAAVHDVGLTVRAGEVVGVAGVAGNGQEELVEALMGLRPAAAGTIRVNGRDVTAAPVAARRAAGLAHVPGDRHGVGTAAGASCEENLLLGFHRQPAFSRRGWLRRAAVSEHARTLIQRFGIRVRGPQVPVETLSGGNLQKVVVARELAHQAPVLLVEQPTRGVDIGAVTAIHGELAAYRDAGGALLLVSAELTEILGLSTRVLVMFEGRVVADRPAADLDEATAGLLMSGVEPAADLTRPRTGRTAGDGAAT